jgi:hypothetical protein
MVPLTQKHGVLPTKNYQRGTFDGWQAISGQTLTEKYQEKTSACGAGEGPEFETGFALSSMCMVDDLADRSYRRRINSISKSFGQSFPVTKRRSRAAS